MEFVEIDGNCRNPSHLTKKSHLTKRVCLARALAERLVGGRVAHSGSDMGNSPNRGTHRLVPGKRIMTQNDFMCKS